jgi:hypothetical protein
MQWPVWFIVCNACRARPAGSSKINFCMQWLQRVTELFGLGVQYCFMLDSNLRRTISSQWEGSRPALSSQPFKRSCFVSYNLPLLTFWLSLTRRWVGRDRYTWLICGPMVAEERLQKKNIDEPAVAFFHWTLSSPSTQTRSFLSFVAYPHFHAISSLHPYLFL